MSSACPLDAPRCRAAARCGGAKRGLSPQLRRLPCDQSLRQDDELLPSGSVPGRGSRSAAGHERQVRAARAPSPPAELDRAGRPGASSLTAGAVRTVARFALRASTARAAQLSATHNLFGHHVHLFFCRQPAGAVPDVPAVRSRRPEQPHVEGPQLPFESRQLRDPLPRLGQLVRDQMAQTIALGSDICVWAGHELAYLPLGEAQSLRALDEPKPVDRRRTVDPVTTPAPVDRLHQSRPFVVAKSRGRNADQARQLADSHLALDHGRDATPSTALQGQARRCPFVVDGAPE